MNTSVQDDISLEEGRSLNDRITGLKDDYKTDQITAKDIFLPPFKDNMTNEETARLRQDYIMQRTNNEINQMESERQAELDRQRIT